MIPALQGFVLARRKNRKLWHLARPRPSDQSICQWYEAICVAGRRGAQRWFYEDRRPGLEYSCLTATIPEGGRICPACLGKLEEQE